MFVCRVFKPSVIVNLFKWGVCLEMAGDMAEGRLLEDEFLAHLRTEIHLKRILLNW